MENSLEYVWNMYIEYQEDPAEAITDADYADYIALFANTPTQANSQLHSLEQAAGDIGLYMNANKTNNVSSIAI